VAVDGLARTGHDNYHDRWCAVMSGTGAGLSGSPLPLWDEEPWTPPPVGTREAEGRSGRLGGAAGLPAAASGRHAGSGTAAGQPAWLTAAALRARGWTDAAIRRFLGAPDRTVANPVYRSAAPLRLYDPARVAAVEATAAWRAWQARSAVRRAVAQAAAEQRRRQTIATVAALPIRVIRLPRAELEQRAVSHRNARVAERAERRGWDGGWDGGWGLADEPATADGVDPQTLARWCVNWLRHQGTRYDQALDDLYARVGRREAARLLRVRVYEAIAAAYPWLAAEAQRQQAQREAEEA
jgi:hypothetical protein